MASSPSSDTAAAPTGVAAALVAAGNLVFRHRNAMAPLLFVGILLTTRPRRFAGSARSDLLWDLCGLLVALSGQTLRILVIGLAYIQRGGKNRTIAADKLVVDGIFAHVRHPLYVGNFLMLTGLMIIWNSLGGYVVLAVAGLALLSMARAEDAFLAGKFGAAFADYRRRVPRFVPNPRGMRATLSRFTFDWKRVARKEYGTVFAFASCVLVLFAVERLEWDGAGALPGAVTVILPLWLVVVCAWAAVRWMKKTRRLVSPD